MGTVKIWDIEKGEAALSVSGHSDIIQSVDWNYGGSLLATTSKDKKIRVIDPRSSSVAQEAAGHPGVKGSRCIWLGDKEKIFNVGFSRTSDRCYSILDPSEWLGGANKPAIKISLEGGFVAKPKTEFKPTVVKEVKEEKPKTETEWKQEVEALNKRVAYLEAEIAKKDARIKELEN